MWRSCVAYGIFLLCMIACESQASDLNRHYSSGASDAQNVAILQDSESNLEPPDVLQRKPRILKSQSSDDGAPASPLLHKLRRTPPPKRKPPTRRPPPKQPPPIPPPPPPSPPIVSPPPTIPTSTCSFSIDGTPLTNFQTCSEMTDRRGRATGTVYYALSGELLTVGFQAASTSPGWIAWALAPNGMIGANAIFSKSDGSHSTNILNGYSASLFGPSVVQFSNVKVGRAADGALAGTATVPWPPGQSAIFVVLGSGPVSEDGSPQIHYGVPRMYTLNKDTLTQK